MRYTYADKDLRAIGNLTPLIGIMWGSGGPGTIVAKGQGYFPDYDKAMAHGEDSIYGFKVLYDLRPK